MKTFEFPYRYLDPNDVCLQEEGINEDGVIDGNRKRLKLGNVSPRRPVPGHITKPPYLSLSQSLQSQVDSRFTTRKPGVTTDEIDEAVHNMIIQNGAYPSPLGYGATFFCGDVDGKAKKLVQVTKEALDRAISICGPGVEYKKIGKTILDHADKHKYGVVRQLLGHGIGRVFHAF
ncbi:hypothetical protein Rs2_37287 [Raphanus sativus]|nr:hypothetical protein Rs2_37287 [Raphanus sativus]